MSYSQLERVVLAAKALAGGVLDSDGRLQWYEAATPFSFVLPGSLVWTQETELKACPASNLAQAQTYCTGPLTGIVEDRSLTALRLTPVPGVNNTWVALETYGDFTTWIQGWIKPAFIPRTNGLPSTGYAARLFEGDPAVTGTEVLTTEGTTGTGINKSVGWVFNYDLGMLMVAEDFNGFTDPYVRGFVYIGTTASSAQSTGNIDGGRPDEVFGGVMSSPIDGGTP